MTHRHALRGGGCNWPGSQFSTPPMPIGSGRTCWTTSVPLSPSGRLPARRGSAPEAGEGPTALYRDHVHHRAAETTSRRRFNTLGGQPEKRGRVGRATDPGRCQHRTDRPLWTRFSHQRAGARFGDRLPVSRVHGATTWWCHRRCSGGGQPVPRAGPFPCLPRRYRSIARAAADRHPRSAVGGTLCTPGACCLQTPTLGDRAVRSRYGATPPRPPRRRPPR